MSKAEADDALHALPRGVLASLRDRLRARRRVVAAVLVGALLVVVLPLRLAGEIRLALAWDGAVLVYLVQALVLVRRSHPEEMRRQAMEEDVGVAGSLLVSLLAAALSLGTVGALLLASQDLPAHERVRHLVLCGATILLSWITVHTFFAIHYAHAYFEDADGVPGGPIRKGLRFPSEEQPDYWDFVYYAFVVGMTAQVADVDITGREMRRATLVHGVISFAFNTVILAFAVNIAAGLI